MVLKKLVCHFLRIIIAFLLLKAKVTNWICSVGFTNIILEMDCKKFDDDMHHQRLDAS